jgi:hypothetical protein
LGVEAHQALARDGLDHPQRETSDSARARSFDRLTIWLPLTPVAGSISSGDDRARVGRNHVRGDVEIRELLLDQARGVLEGVLRHRLGAHRRRLEQRERRQLGVGGQVDEQRGLALGLGTFGALDPEHRRLDAHRHGFVVEDLAQALDLLLALGGRDLADAAVAARSERLDQPVAGALDRQPHVFEDGQPGKPRPETEARSDDDEQQHGAADRSQRSEQGPAGELADDSARSQRQFDGQAVQPGGFEPDAAEHEESEAEPALPGEAVEVVRGLGRHGELRRMQAPVATHHAGHAQRHQQIGGHAEQVKQQVREPGAHPAAGVLDVIGDHRVRPAGVGLVVGGEDQQQEEPEGDPDDPSGLAEQLDRPLGQAEACSEGPAAGRRGRGGST